MLVCPRCVRLLGRNRASGRPFWLCGGCGGRVVSLAVLVDLIHERAVRKLLERLPRGRKSEGVSCPSCAQTMIQAPASGRRDAPHLDYCRACLLIWFDPREYEALPARLPEDSTGEASEGPALAAIRAVMTVFGLPVEATPSRLSRMPWVTWILALVILFAGTQGILWGTRAIEALGLIPSMYWRYGGATFLTSFFLHMGVIHLLTNLYFLMVSGDNVEDYLGHLRYGLLLAGAALAGGVGYVVSDPASTVPAIGASGGIAGVMTFYTLRFPRARFVIFLRPVWLRVPAWLLFLGWAALQVAGLVATSGRPGGVAYSAHLGGALFGATLWVLWRSR